MGETGKAPTKAALIRSSKKVDLEQWLIENATITANERQDAILKGREHSETLKHRGWWSMTLIGIALAINMISLFVVVAIGYGWMQYNSSYAVPAIIAANFAETWALTKIAMKFYFKADTISK